MAHFELTHHQRQVIQSVGAREAGLNDLVAACPDARMAFVVCPVPVTVVQLAEAIAELRGIDILQDRPAVWQLMNELRIRRTAEGWDEERALHQAEVIKAIKDTVVESRGITMAVLAMDFQRRRLTNMLQRYEILHDSAMSVLLQVQAGAPFNSAARDLMGALTSLENQINDMLPISDSGAMNEFWSKRTGDREAIISSVGDKLSNLDATSRASNVFALIDGGKLASNDE